MTDLIYGAVSPTELSLDIRELAARLGNPSLTSFRGLESYIDRVFGACAPVYAVLRTELSADGARLSFGGIETESVSLVKLTEGCSSVLLCAMTLGIEVDRLIAREHARGNAEGFIIDAIASAAAEALAERVSSIAEAKYGRATARFSPGYGDLSLSVSEDILRLVDAERRLGIKTTVGGLMVPKKSITALIGVR